MFYGTLSLHVHHYTLGLLAIPFMCFQTNYVTAAHAVMNGMMVEGIARWGPDAIWIPKSIDAYYNPWYLSGMMWYLDHVEGQKVADVEMS